ncbi:MAG: hypothetical protein JSS23_03215 [Proteobacteria bacterium]|nr:hypothetical protein [Pseudomonadota bacterium]
MNDEVKIARLIKEAQDHMKRPLWIELVELGAREKFAKFTAYKRAGFDAKQALELVIREGSN